MAMAGSLLGRDIRSILVFKQRNIGDVLLSTPAIHALRIAWPQARIAVAVNSGTEAMIEGNPDIDRVIVFDRSARDAGGAGRWREEGRFLGEIRAWRPDLAVQLTEGDRGAILAFLSGARFRAGLVPGRRGLWGKEKLFTHLSPLPSLYRHAVLRDLDVIGAAGIPPADPGLRFFFTEEDRSRASALLSGVGVPDGVPYAVVQPGSRWKFKCWTDAGNAGLLAHLARRHRVAGARAHDFDDQPLVEDHPFVDAAVGIERLVSEQTEVRGGVGLRDVDAARAHRFAQRRRQILGADMRLLQAG